MIFGLIFTIMGLLCVVTTILAVSCVQLWVEVKAMKNSTHQIMMPTNMANSMFQNLDDETKATMTKQPEEYDSFN
jgi:dTDP-4-dehydrorhamnose 3,5-epimerase-like enzyme